VQTANIHGTCIVLARAGRPFGAPEDAGVLMLGESGSGKSDLALRLIERGAALVADDRVDLFARDGALWGRSPASLAGLLEIRGAGIVALPYRTEAAIALVVGLVSPQDVPRLPQHGKYAPPPRLGLPPDEGPPFLKLAGLEASAPAKIAAIAAALGHALFRDSRNPS